MESRVDLEVHFLVPERRTHADMLHDVVVKHINIARWDIAHLPHPCHHNTVDEICAQSRLLCLIVFRLIEKLAELLAICCGLMGSSSIELNVSSGFLIAVSARTAIRLN